MKRSAGVTVVAILSLLGSVLAMCFGVATGAMAFLMPQPASTRPPTALLVIAGAVYFLPGVWGLLTSIGLFRLKNWARISTIVFAVLLILFGGFTAVAAIAMSAFSMPPSDQINPTAAASAVSIMRGTMGVLALGEIGVGAWWLIYFLRAKVAQQFTGGATAPLGSGSGRPVSITIIAWFILVGSLGLVSALAFHAPLPFFVITLTGLPAGLYLIAMGATLVYSGIGLLKLWPTARLVAIGYFVFGLVNGAVFALAPGGHARLAALVERQQEMMPPWANAGQQALPFDPTALVYFSMVAGLILTTVPLYFLVTRKHAFKTA